MNPSSTLDENGAETCYQRPISIDLSESLKMLEDKSADFSTDVSVQAFS